jgi:hypothetical protein
LKVKFFIGIGGLRVREGLFALFEADFGLEIAQGVCEKFGGLFIFLYRHLYRRTTKLTGGDEA